MLNDFATGVLGRKDGKVYETLYEYAKNHNVVN